MKIIKLRVDGFRCLLDFEIVFEDDITVIVGENDAGKSSLIDCLKAITQNKKIELDDFNLSCNCISISIEIENYVFYKTYTRANGSVTEEPTTAKPTKQYLSFVESFFRGLNGTSIDTDKAEQIKRYAREFGVIVRTNSNVNNLISNVLDKIGGANSESEIVISGASFPQFNNIQLDGRHFENIAAFFKEVFLREKQTGIWQEKVADGKTIEEFVKERIDTYSKEISTNISEQGILERMRIFLKSLAKIKIEPIYQTRDLNIDAKVKFLEGEDEREINIDKKGDGTKRRITMALLEFKKEKSLLEHDKTTIYLLDEPDTHLHVKAQTELLDTISGFAKNGNQIILTTHSPFVINAVSPRQIRLLENAQNRSIVKCLKSEATASDEILKALGIENTYLFFSRHLVIVEGKTEENFIPSYFLSKLNRTISSSLIKIVNAQGITNIPGFAKAILELHDPRKIYILFDNDASPDLLELINELSLPDEQKYIIGEREFEDSFESQILYECWMAHLNKNGGKPSELWTLENIEKKKAHCKNTGAKFSRELRSLNTKSKKMSKSLLGKAIGEHIKESDLPAQLRELIQKCLQ